MFQIILKTLFSIIFSLGLSSAFSVTVSDDFTVATDNNNWAPLYSACLTSGTSSNNNTSNSKIPGCNYSSPDAIGSGALRLTPAQGNQQGAIVSGYTFPSNQGLQVTFTTYTYGGSKDGLASDGADGLSFFLMDGSVGTTVGGVSNVGSWGGSLAYSCSNVNSPYTGLTGAYLGLGIDEYGNFLNGGSGNDNTWTGIPVQTTSASTHGYNSFYSGSFMQANRIGMRGAGNVSWYWLNKNYPGYYPSTLSDTTKQAAVQNTCKTGTLWNYSGAISQVIVDNPSVSGTTMTVAVANASSFVNGDSVNIGGTITATVPVQSISGNPTISGSTMTVTVPSVAGYSNTQTVSIGGTISANANSQTVTSISLNSSGTTLTLSAPSVNNYAQGQTINISGSLRETPGALVSSFSNYSSKKNTVDVNLSSTSGINVGDAVFITGATSPNNGVVNGTHTVASVSSSLITINVSGWSGKNSNLPNIGASPNQACVNCGNAFALSGPFGISAVDNNSNPKTFSITLPTPALLVSGSGTAPTGAVPTVPGNYTIDNVNASNNTFTVTLSSSASSITNTSGTVTTPAPTVLGTYTISNVNTSNNTFQVSLGSVASAISNVSGAVIDNSSNSSGRQLATTVMDYPVIPGGFWVLPSNNLIANENTSARSGAWPITYKLAITPSGLLSLNYSYNNGAYQSVLTNWSITAANGPLPSTFRFGFAASTGGSTNIHEITCFVAQPTESSSSAGANTVQSGQVRTGTQVYLASYNPNNWSGSLVSDAIVNTNGVLSVSTAAQWDGNCVLTGGGCSSMGTTSGGVPTNTITVQAPSSRNILTWDGYSGIPFEWTKLTSAQQSVLNASDSAGANRLDWLRGGRTQEQSSSGTLRTRAGVLGDIVGSSPTWVGPPLKNYPATFTDILTGTIGAESSYVTFKNSLATRMNVVYAGSNDGILHGFRTGSNNADGTYNGSTNDGYEVLGYVPSTVLSSANVVNLTSPNYGHDYFVDAAPGFGDVYYNGAWHTWLVGGMGPGGAGLYALDVTDPTGAVNYSQAFSQSHASSLVIGDWTPASLTAATCVNASIGCGNNLGNTYGSPLIRRLHNGKWAIIFGNGLGSTNGHAGVYVGLISPSNGSVSFYWLDTGVGVGNGITNVSSADLDGDFVIDYLYAGDLQGNVWRFDLTSSNPANWAASKFGQPTATPLYVAKDGSGNRQPITSSIAVTATLTGDAQRVILGFGTGRATPFTSSSTTTYQTGTQSVYGIWDWDMTSWNGMSSSHYATLAAVTTSPYRTFTRTDLFTDTVAIQTSSIRTATTAIVCWNDSSACVSGNTQYGWKFDLPDSGEQVIYNPVFTGGVLLLNTTIPPQNSVGQCTLLLPTGWSMAFDMGSGGGKRQNVFPDSNGNLIVTTGASSIVGLKQGAVGAPYIVSIGSKQYAISSSVGGSAPPINQLNTQGGVTGKRVSWEQLR